MPFCFLLFNSQILFSQKESNYWYFGGQAGLSFNSNQPTNLSDGKLIGIEGCSTISNGNGELLFYTDGRTVWNKNHEIMQNGEELYGGASSTQSSIIVPKPGTVNKYYIFTVAEEAKEPGLRYSEVDINADGGLGRVTNLKNVLITTPVCEKIASIKICGTDNYWVITHGYGNRNFYAYNVTSTGVDTNPVISTVGSTISFSHNLAPYNVQGYLKISPDGSKIVSVNSYYNVELFDFDQQIGVLSNPRVVSKAVNGNEFYGAEFSPNAKLLYLSGGSANKIVQYDILSNDIENSGIDIITLPGYRFGAYQMAPDGKIYVPTYNDLDYWNFNLLFNKKLSVINFPDVRGFGCKFIHDQISLTRRATGGLPQFVVSFYNVNIIAEGTCQGDITKFSLGGCQDIISASWNFGDGNTSTSIDSENSYANPGVYQVSVDITSTSGSFTKNTTIEITDSPISFVNAINSCENISGVYDLRQNDTKIIGTQSILTFGVSYFSSLSNAVTHTNVLADFQTISEDTSIFYAKIYNYNNFDCYEIIPVNIIHSEKPLLKSDFKRYVCDSFPYDGIETIELNDINSDIIENINSGIFYLSYYTSLSDALDGINAIPSTYTNNNLTETLYVRAESILNPICFEVEEISIIVERSPLMGVISDYTICDDQLPNDGKMLFDLASKNSEVLDGQLPSDFSIKYYLSLSDAQNDVNSLNSNYTNSLNPETIFVRTSNSISNECYKIGSFEINVKPKPEFLIDPFYYICEDVGLVNITILEDFHSYNWSNGDTTSTTTIYEAGSYNVIVTQQEGNLICETRKDFSVTFSSVATLINIETVDFNNDQNSITVFVSGLGDYEYSLDGINYQDSNIFDSISGGEYMVYIRDKNGCGSITERTYVLTYPKYFTPNSDGYNDYWKINFSHLKSNMEIKIFDRYGKLIKIMDKDSSGWDGTFNGYDLPSADYWFVIETENGKEIKGHFSLKR